MNGNVYVFNVYSQTLTVSINGLQIESGDIPDWSTGTGGARYRPNAAAVPRVLNASDSPGKFFNGPNNVTLSWLDGLYVANVRIDGGSLPLNQDLLLFVSKHPAWAAWRSI
jgi:hypothetical protein